MTRVKKKLSIITLGCQMNKHDSGWISGLLADEYDYTDDNSEADLLIVNTCAVREKAEDKFFSQLGRLRPLKEKNKNMVIGVAGCVAQELGEKIVKRDPSVDIVFGTRAIEKLPELLQRFEETGRPQIDTSDTSDYDDFPQRRDSEFLAWVSIMRGCDNFCSYCIVPQTRGPEQSRPMESILAEIKSLGEGGYKEITLLGQNVNSYGRGLSSLIDFPELLYEIDKLNTIPRVRFVTSHPKDLSDRLINAMEDLPSVCPALHLPIQSGSNEVLDRMSRGYTVEKYFERVGRLRSKIPDLALTSDLIVGFPGETDDDFKATVEAVKRAEFENIYLFKYSPRPGTAAADYENTVSGEVVKARFDQILALQKEITIGRMAKWAGRQVEVLVEGFSKKDRNRYSGRTPQNHLVVFDSETDFTGAIIRVSIGSARLFCLEGSAVL